MWADFDSTGRVAVAATGGELKVLEVNGADIETVFSNDLNPLDPNPVEAPAWAKNW